MQSYQREIRDFLVKSGGTHVRFVRDGGHPRVYFILNSKEEHDLLSSTPSDMNAIRMEKRRLKKKFGLDENQPTQPKEKRSLEEMLSNQPLPFNPLPVNISGSMPLEPLKTDVYPGRMANYKSSKYNSSLRFYIPKELHYIIPVGSKVSQTSDDMWEIQPTDKSHQGHIGKDNEISFKCERSMPLFGRSSADFWATDGKILVHLHMDKIVPVIDRSPNRVTKTAPNISQLSDIELLAMTTLQNIKKIESTKLLKLVRLKAADGKPERWGFNPTAHRIELP